MGNEKPARRYQLHWISDFDGSGYQVISEDDLPAEITIVRASDYDAIQQRELKLREALEAYKAIAERVCTNYAPSQKMLRELDNARMLGDAALRSSDHIEGEK